MAEDIFSIGNIIADLGEGISILDGGAGAGTFPYADFPDCRIVSLDLKTSDATGVPPNNERVVGNLEDMPFAEDEFDLVILNFVLEHTLNPEKVLGEVAKVLKPEGVFYLSVPDAKSLDDRMFRFAHRLTHPSSWFHPSPDYHHQKFTVDSIRELLSKSGFTIMARLEYPGGFNWMPRKLRDLFLRCCRTLGLNPTRRGSFIVLAGRGEYEEEPYRRPYVCFECGITLRDIDVDGGRWRCEHCGFFNPHFPPSDE